jgi:hypothetical protein
MAIDSRPSLLAELEEELEEEYLLATGLGAAELETLWERGPSTPVCPGPTREIVSRFRRYSNAVGLIPADERNKLKTISARIVASYKPGCQRLPRLRVTGHADPDSARERSEPGFEQLISRQRALAVQQEIVKLINNQDISSRLAFDRRGVGASAPVFQKPANEREREMNRRVEIDLASSCTCTEFFEEYDKRTLPSDVRTNPTLTQSERTFRIADVTTMVGELLTRRERRAAASLQGNILPSASTSTALIPVARRLSAVQVNLFRQCLPDGAGGINLTSFQNCFEQFANGELRLGRDGLREPDGGFYFLFAEFAFLCIDSVIQAAIWTRLLKYLVQTEEIFMHVYRPAPAAPAPFPAPPAVNAPLPAQGPAIRGLDSYDYRNFNAAGQSDANRKAALRRKYDGTSLAQLRLAARDNMLRAQRMP